MDGPAQDYRRIVLESAARLIADVDCSPTDVAITGQLQEKVVGLQTSRLMVDRELCSFVLRTSDSPVAQSYRNTRLTNSGSRLNDRRWAGLVFASDVRETVLKQLRLLRFEDPEARNRVLAWQQQDALRGNFSDDTPWCVIADWHDEHGDTVQAELCREFHTAGRSNPTAPR